MSEIFDVKDTLPNVEYGSFLVYAPKSFPKNCRWLVAEYYDDVKGFYSEASEEFLSDVTHWTTLPNDPTIESKERCYSCKTEAANEEHVCPFKDEIYEDETQCNCCDSCTHECRQSI